MAESYHANGAASSRSYTFSQKWGDDPFTAMGYAQIPLALFRYGARLGIAPDEGYLICHIWQFKWSPSDEGPSESLLAERFGKSDDTVRKLLHRLQNKGFLKIERRRGDLGYYTHTVYDFRQLRDWLNECYWQDHPQERPKAKKPRRLPAKTAATPQIRGVVKQQRKTPPPLPAEPPLASPQNGGEPPRKSAGTLKEREEKKESEDADSSTSSFPEKSSDRITEQTSDKTAPPNAGYAQFKQSPEAQQFAQWRQGKGRAPSVPDPAPDLPEDGVGPGASESPP